MAVEVHVYSYIHVHVYVLHSIVLTILAEGPKIILLTFLLQM